MHRTTASKGALLLGLLCSLVCSTMMADAAPVASVAATVGAGQPTAGTEPVVQLPRARRGSIEFIQHANKHCYGQTMPASQGDVPIYPSLDAAEMACAVRSNCFGVQRGAFAFYLCDARKITSSAKLTPAWDSSSSVYEKPASIAGEFVETSYGAAANDWHFVTVTSTTSATQRVYQWVNRAGVAWTLTRDRDDRGLFHVGASCPYYAQGYTTARATFDSRTGAVAALQGPGNGVYLLRGTVPAHDPALCPHGLTSATCWGDSAYQMCPLDRQGAYHKVMARRGSQEAMHAVFARLTVTGLGCTKALPADQYFLCPQWKSHCAKSSPSHSWMGFNCATTCWNAF